MVELSCLALPLERNDSLRSQGGWKDSETGVWTPRWHSTSVERATGEPAWQSLARAAEGWRARGSSAGSQGSQPRNEPGVASTDVPDAAAHARARERSRERAAAAAAIALREHSWADMQDEEDDLVPAAFQALPVDVELAASPHAVYENTPSPDR